MSYKNTCGHKLVTLQSAYHRKKLPSLTSLTFIELFTFPQSFYDRGPRFSSDWPNLVKKTLDLTPKKVLTPCQDLSDIGADFAYKTFFGVGSLEIQGFNPEESLD